MSDAREEILGRLRRAAAVPGSAPPAEISATPAAAVPGTPRERFVAGVRASAATVAVVADEAGAARAVAAYLESVRLPDACVDASARLAFREGLILRTGSALRPDGDTLICGCIAAVAEEGAVVLASGAAHAAEAAFVAATLVVIVRATELVESLEALWPRLQALGPPHPRMINIVRGPSRTADLGVPSRLGAHGPVRMHVILVDPDLGL
jgi:L-lactate dehydrogenase complex protein LldG